MATTVNNKYKTFVQRLFASFIDWLVFLPVYIIEEIFSDKNNKWLFIGFSLFYTISWLLYCAIGHGKYGQTVGKKVMKIKVLGLDEKGLIGYQRAFLRESVWFFVSIAGITWLIIQSQGVAYLSEIDGINYANMGMFISLAWLLIELVTMLSNPKRRAVHDFLAGSVVIDMKEAQKEEMSKVTN